MLRHFTKYSANGNHFILFDAFQNKLEALSPAFVKDLCDPYFGVGADGVVLLSSHRQESFDFRLWNTDGSEAEMCGNAARCASWHYFQQHTTSHSASFKTMNAVYQVRSQKGEIELQMSEFKFNPQIKNSDLGLAENCYAIDTGVPHLVILKEKMIDDHTFNQLAPQLRRHKIFPKGTNVDFISFDPHAQLIHLRVFERGVEGETWSCGTGVSAAAWAYRKNFEETNKSQSTFPFLKGLKIQTKGGLHTVYWDQNNQLWYRGEVKKIFTGELTPSL